MKSQVSVKTLREHLAIMREFRAPKEAIEIAERLLREAEAKQ